MTPAEELNTAATILREAGGNATAGDWQADPAHETSDFDVNSVGPKGAAPIAYDVDEADSRWVVVAQPSLAEPLATWLEAEAQRWNSEITRDIPECPACDGSPGCHHEEEDFHDGGRDGSGCDRVYGATTDPCRCWDHALAVARSLMCAAEVDR